MSNQAKVGVCINCVYLNFTAGECRRNAPVVTISGDWAGMSGWPHVAATDWCGEYVETVVKSAAVAQEIQL